MFTFARDPIVVEDIVWVCTRRRLVEGERRLKKKN